MSGAHAHWVWSLDTQSHATEGKKCANGTGSLIVLYLYCIFVLYFIGW